MEFEIVRNRATRSKIHVWDNFGLIKYPEKDLDQKYVACTICRMQLKYNGNTSNLADPLAAPRGGGGG